MTMKKWDEQVREDHQALEAQVGALEAALTIDVGARDRRVVLSWIIRTLAPSIELHLRKEEEVLFPALERLLGGESGAITLLREQHRGLRQCLRRLAECVQDPENIDWQATHFAGQALIELLEDHEAKEDRLLIDVLEFSLKPKELKSLAQAFRDVAQKAHAEEGWPVSKREEHDDRPR